MRAFDARCHECDSIHVVWVAWDHDEDDEIRYAHKGCLSYGPHTLESELTGLSDHEMWGPDG